MRLAGAQRATPLQEPILGVVTARKLKHAWQWQWQGVRQRQWQRVRQLQWQRQSQSAAGQQRGMALESEGERRRQEPEEEGWGAMDSPGSPLRPDAFSGGAG